MYKKVPMKFDMVWKIISLLLFQLSFGIPLVEILQQNPSSRRGRYPKVGGPMITNIKQSILMINRGFHRDSVPWKIVWKFIHMVLDQLMILINQIGCHNVSHPKLPGPNCSKLTMSSVNVSLKLCSLNMAYTLIFLLKTWVAFAFQQKIPVN